MYECNATILGATAWPGGTSSNVYYQADATVPGGYRLVVGSLLSKAYGSVPAAANTGEFGTGGTSPNAMSLAWGDGSGWRFNLGAKSLGVFAPRMFFQDDGRFSIAYNQAPAAPSAVVHVDGANSLGGLLINQSGGTPAHIRLQRTDLGSTITIRNDAGYVATDGGLKVASTSIFTGKATFGSATLSANSEAIHTTSGNSGVSMDDRTPASHRWILYPLNQVWRLANGLRGDVLSVGINGNTFHTVNSAHTGQGLTVRLDRTSGADHAWGRAALCVESYIGTDSAAGIAFHAHDIAPQLLAYFPLGARLNVVNDANSGYVPIAASAFTVASSLRFKTDVRYSDQEFLDIVRDLAPIEFRNRTEVIAIDHDCSTEDCAGDADRPCPMGVGRAKRFGLAAEDVAEVFPLAVTFDPDGRAETIDYQVLTALLIGAVNQLSARMSGSAGH